MFGSRLFGIRLLLAGLCSFAPLSRVADSAESSTPVVHADTVGKCLTILREGLKSEEFWPSMHAAEVLTLAGHGNEVLAALKGRLDHEQDARQRCGLAREQIRAGDRSKIAELEAVLGSSDSYGHIHACESLFKVRAVGDRGLMKKAMNDSSSPTKALMAAAALYRDGDAQALAFIRDQLRKADPQSSWIAAWLVGALGDAQDLPALRDGLARSTVPRSRGYFENALGRLGDPVGRQALVANLENPDPVVRADAAYMVGITGQLSTQTRLKVMLNDENLDVRIRAAQGLLALNKDLVDPNDIVQPPATGNQPDRPKPASPYIVLKLAPGPGNSRNSEGDFIQTKDGRMLFIYSYFGKGTGDDYDTAELRERVSNDGGMTWSTTERTIVRPESGLNVMSVSLLRLSSGAIALFYCAKVSHSDCRPQMRLSTDEGRTWGPAQQVVTDLVDYYVLNNSRVGQLKSGRIIVPLCLHRTLDPKKNDWAGQLVCYLSDDQGKTWRRSKSIFEGKDVAGKRVTVQEPGVVELKDGRVMMFIRSSIGSQMIAYSQDGGDTWSAPVASNIIAPISPASIKRIPKTGDLVLVWNDHSSIPAALRGKRTPLSVAISKDDGKTWEKTKKLYDDPNGWYCYIAIDFVGDDVLLGHCAGDRRKNGLAITDITRFSLDWLYDHD